MSVSVLLVLAAVAARAAQAPDTDKPIDVVLAVVATAAGQPLSRTEPGQRVAITCEPAAPAPAASAPVSLGDCVRVIEIDARPKPR